MVIHIYNLKIGAHIANETKNKTNATKCEYLIDFWCITLLLFFYINLANQFKLKVFVSFAFYFFRRNRRPRRRRCCCCSVVILSCELHTIGVSSRLKKNSGSFIRCHAIECLLCIATAIATSTTKSKSDTQVHSNIWLVVCNTFAYAARSILRFRILFSTLMTRNDVWMKSNLKFNDVDECIKLGRARILFFLLYFVPVIFVALFQLVVKSFRVNWFMC